MLKAEEYVKGDKINEGKTKIIWSVSGDPALVIIENKNDITKNDDPSATEIMSGKAKYATATTCAVFNLLKEAVIPNSFLGQISDTEFLAKSCDMISLEVIGRRYAVGSFLKRHPELKKVDGVSPHRFHNWKFELFLKTSGGKMVDKKGFILVVCPPDILSEDERRIDDPFIVNPYAERWSLAHPKMPSWEKGSDLEVSVLSDFVLPEGVKVEHIEVLLRKVVLVLEGAFAQLGIRFIDLKIEFGITTDGELVVSDVIDNDSWRVRDANWQELSKQLFRDDADMVLIKDKYALMADLVQSFRIPKQAIVVWRGSENDDDINVSIPSVVSQVGVVCSGHKSPAKCIVKLEEILAEFPEGGVIIALIGMSNGLGPMLAARTNWPVIAVPATAKERPHDVWSSLETPSNVPINTILSPKNAIFSALNILAQKNPVVYMERQLKIEEFDL